MLKFYKTLQNERGDVLPNYRLQVVDSAGAIVTIYQDEGGTRFTDASGNIVNYTTAAANGLAEGYYNPEDGQVLQILDPAGNLVGAIADFSENHLLFLQQPVPEWFGGVADFVGNEAGGTGTDNAAAINACLDEYGVCYLRGSYGVSSPILIDGNNQALITSGTGTGRLYTLPGFTGDAVVLLTSTRGTVSGVNVTVTGDVFDHTSYDPLSPPAVAPHGIETTDLHFHQHIRDCRVYGANAGFKLGSLECKLESCVSDNCYDNVYIEPDGSGTAYDQSIRGFIGNNAVRYGLYSERGIEGHDLHLVRSGECSLRINGGTPNKIFGIYLDTPTKKGIHLTSCNGGVFMGINAKSFGELRPFDGGATTGTGTTPDHACHYVKLEKSRDNTFLFDGIEFDYAISQDEQYFLSIDVDDAGDPSASLADTNRSIRNSFQQVPAVTLPVVESDATQRKFATWQRWTNCTGAAGRFNNEGYAYVGETIALAAGETRNISFPVKDVDLAAGGSFSMATFEYSIRKAAGDRQAGTGIIPIVRAGDTGSGDGVFVPAYTVGSVPAFSITGVTVRTATAGQRTTSYFEYTITNTDGLDSGTICHQVRPILDNQGPD